MFVVQLGSNEYVMHGPFESVNEAATWAENYNAHNSAGMFTEAITIIPLSKPNPAYFISVIANEI